MEQNVSFLISIDYVDLFFDEHTFILLSLTTSSIDYFLILLLFFLILLLLMLFFFYTIDMISFSSS